MDLDKLSDDELLQLYRSSKGKEQELNDQLRRPTEEQRQAAMDATGLSDVGTGGRFLAGVGKAFTNIGTGSQQLFGGDSPQLRKQIDEENKLFSQYGGTAGMLGELAGGVAAAAPAAVLAAPAGAAAVIGSGAVGGAISGALQPRGEQDSLARNIALGGALGAAVPGAIKAGSALSSVGGKTVNAILGRTGSSADRKVSQYLSSQIADMTPDEASSFNSIIGNMQSGRIATPAQLIDKPSTSAAEQALISTPRAHYRLQDMSAKQQQQEIATLKDMAQKLPNADVLSTMSPGTMTDAYESTLKKNVQEATRPFYEQLKQVPVSTQQQATIFKDNNLLDTLKQASQSSDFTAETRNRLNSLLTSQGQDAKLSDLHDIYKQINKQYYKNTGDKVLVDAKQRLENILSQDPNFVQGNQIYKEQLSLLNQLRDTKLHNLFKNSPDNIFTAKDGAKATKLGDILANEAPELLNDLASQKLLTLVNSFGTKSQPSNIVQQLDRVAAVHGTPQTQAIVDNIKQAISRPALSPKGVPSKGPDFSVLGVLRTNPVSVASSLMAKLQTNKGQDALVELLTNPTKWGPLAQKAIASKNGSGSGLSHLLDMITSSTGFSAGQLPAMDIKDLNKGMPQ